jgi:hypothetical protein
LGEPKLLSDSLNSAHGRRLAPLVDKRNSGTCCLPNSATHN